MLSGNTGEAGKKMQGAEGSSQFSVCWFPALVAKGRADSWFRFRETDVYLFITIGYTPSPRSIGIIELAPKSNLIYGAQQLTGKILSRKELGGWGGVSKSLGETYSIRRQACLRQVYESRLYFGPLVSSFSHSAFLEQRNDIAAPAAKTTNPMKAQNSLIALGRQKRRSPNAKTAPTNIPTPAPEAANHQTANCSHPCDFDSSTTIRALSHGCRTSSPGIVPEGPSCVSGAANGWVYKDGSWC
jgi:hypothetical protein